jgi:hypothetical protein
MPFIFEAIIASANRTVNQREATLHGVTFET